MPDPEEQELDAMIAAADPEEADLDAMIAEIDTPAVNHARELAAAAPPPARPLTAESEVAGNKPWYSQFADSVTDNPVSRSAATFGENVASGFTSNTTDELGSLLMGAGSDHGAAATGQPSTYAAGSRFEDNRKTLEGEKAERDAENPVAATAGQVAGTVGQAAALPGIGAGSLAARGLAAGGQGGAMAAANVLGAGEGDLENRVDQLGQYVEEHPIASGASVSLPAAAQGISSGLRAGAQGLDDMAYRNRTAAIMTPGERTTYASNHGGKAGLTELGQQMERAKLHGEWWQPWASADNVADNAVKLRDAAAQRLGAAEDVLTGADANPNVDVGGITKGLRGIAEEAPSHIDTKAWDAKANFATRMSDQLDSLTTPKTIAEADALGSKYRDVELPRQADYQPVQTQTQFEPSNKLPLNKAIAERRDLDANINYGKRGSYENAGTDEALRRAVATGLRKNIGNSMDELAVQRPEMAQHVTDWRKANEDFSLGATVAEPAMGAAQAELGGKLGLRDFNAVAAANALGLPGPAAVAAGHLMQGRGRWANAAASVQHKGADLARRGAEVADMTKGFTTAAVGAPSSTQAKQTNQAMKDKINEQSSWDWIKSLLGTDE